jgi:hypothetical protein
LFILENGSSMNKKIFLTLFAVLSALANAQPIPQGVQDICINIRWAGATLEASCLKNLYGYGGSEGGYQFSSLPYANECYPPPLLGL